MKGRGSASVDGSAVVGFLLGLAAAALIAAAVWWAFRSGVLETRRIDTSRPTVVSRIQRLQRLETVVFGMDKIVTGERENRFLPRFLAGERLLLIVFGEVTAGVDVGHIELADVTVSGRTLRLRLPEPEVFSARLDNERTRVYSRETGLFTRVDPDLESEVRREAERQVRQAALDNGILEMAARNARTTLMSFVQGLGFEQVEIP
jgi:Protein of unknown function (DUF4230)